MTFKEVLGQVVDRLQQDSHVSYLARKRQFDLDDNDLADLKEALAFSHPQARDEEGRWRVWTGERPAISTIARSETEREIYFGRFFRLSPRWSRCVGRVRKKGIGRA